LNTDSKNNIHIRKLSKRAKRFTQNS